MRHLSLVLFMVLVLPLASLQAQSRAQKPNDFTIELGGRCILYAVSYQRMLGETFGLEVGASWWGGGKSDFIFPESLLFLSGGARLYLSKKNTAPTLSAGIVYATAAWDSGSFTVHGHGVYFYATPGFEYRASGGFVFRAGVNFLYASSLKIWPGISLGIAF
jgi:hypothetical protein